MWNNRQEVINAFKTGIFPCIQGFQIKEESEEKLEEKTFYKYIENESIDINHDLFEKHFKFIAPTVLAKELFETKYKEKKDASVAIINSGLKGLKKEITDMSEEEKKSKNQIT